MGTTITTGDSEFGTMLFDARKQAIYLFDKETAAATPTPQCYGDCAAAWPPVLTQGTPVAAGAVNAALLGSTTRTDGTTQVTYGGHPLYYYAGDSESKDTYGQGINSFGAKWWLVAPSGSAITGSAGSAPSATAPSYNY
jgi:predicted lipoprotein with Yx(FWY)xxD motif